MLLALPLHLLPTLIVAFNFAVASAFAPTCAGVAVAFAVAFALMLALSFALELFFLLRCFCFC